MKISAGDARTKGTFGANQEEPQIVNSDRQNATGGSRQPVPDHIGEGGGGGRSRTRDRQAVQSVGGSRAGLRGENEHREGIAPAEVGISRLKTEDEPRVVRPALQHQQDDAHGRAMRSWSPICRAASGHVIFR